jgi:Tol biopolymer transport system component
MKPATLFLLAGLLAAALAAGFPANQAKDDRAEVALQAALKKEAVDGDLKGAIELYQKIAQSTNRAAAAKALVHMGQCYEKLGDAEAREARKAYGRVVREFADQKEAAQEARKHLSTMAGDKQAESGLAERQLWVFPKWYFLRGYSTDGRYITFEDDEHGDLWQHDLMTGEDRKLVEASGSYFGTTAISPDGKQIAYSQFHNTALELRVIGIDGSRMRVLLSEKGKHIYPRAWSPDGKRILADLFSPKLSDQQIALISVVDGSIQVLKSAPRIYPFSFSPDGQYILYGRRDANSQPTAIFAMSSDGSREAPLVEGPARNGSAVWTPDGRKVLFLSDRSGADGLWSVRVADGKPAGMPELVKPNVGSMHPLGFTRDGAFCYGSYTSQSDVYVADLDPETGKISSKPERVNERFIGSSKGPLAWSPDGQFLAYNRSGIGGAPPTVVVRTVTTGEEREVPKRSSPSAGSRELRWFPDGRSLLVNDWQNSHTAFRRIDLQTGEGKPVVVEGTDILWVHWQAALSHDGKTLFYSLVGKAGGGGGPLRVMRREIESGEERELYRKNAPGSGLFSLSLSPDERQVAFVTFRWEESVKGNTTPLMVVPAEGGSARELCPKVYTIGGTAWTKDGRHILVPGSDSEHPQQLLSVPIAGGQPQPTGVSMAELSSPSIHPDGRRIAFAGGQSQQSVWAIKNLLAEPTAKKQ